jgi:hypothetical protein
MVFRLDGALNEKSPKAKLLEAGLKWFEVAMFNEELNFLSC